MGRSRIELLGWAEVAREVYGISQPAARLLAALVLDGPELERWRAHVAVRTGRENREDPAGAFRVHLSRLRTALADVGHVDAIANRSKWDDGRVSIRPHAAATINAEVRSRG